MVADRTGFAGALADEFASSQLKRHADEELEAQLRATVDLPPETAAALAVSKETTTPTWWACWVLMRYRMAKNYRSGEFYAAHAAPWLVQSLVMMRCAARRRAPDQSRAAFASRRAIAACAAWRQCSPPARPPCRPCSFVFVWSSAALSGSRGRA